MKNIKGSMLAIYLRGMSGQTADPGSCVASPQTDGQSLKKVLGGSGFCGMLRVTA